MILRCHAAGMHVYVPTLVSFYVYLLVTFSLIQTTLTTIIHA